MNDERHWHVYGAYEAEHPSVDHMFDLGDTDGLWKMFQQAAVWAASHHREGKEVGVAMFYAPSREACRNCTPIVYPWQLAVGTPAP